MARTSGTVSAPTDAILQYGGQAVIEGVMMRSPRFFAVACRKPDGTIVVQRENVDKSIIGKLKWLNFPFGRGTLALIDAMALGIKALAFASNVQMQAIPGVTSAEGSATPPPSQQDAKGVPVLPASGKINDVAIGGTIVVSILFGLGLFVFLPTAITGLLTRLHLTGAGGRHADMRLNIADGLIRMAIFFVYILLISRMENIRRVFMYHGAEHKAINTLEAGQPLNSDNALKSSRIHPRCGTSFIFVVLLINILVFALLPRPALLPVRFLQHLAVVPLVAGIAYEVIKAAGKFRSNPVVMAVFAPGMATQYLTTREPEPAQVEVALAALLSVLEAEGHLAPEASVNTDAPEKDEPAAVMA
jgi:uncharacterized protein YqhQ